MIQMPHWVSRATLKNNERRNDACKRFSKKIEEKVRKMFVF